MNRPRLLALVLAGAIALSFIGLRGARTQSTGLRRVTNTSEEGININPSISGDGRVIAFESTEDVAHAGGTDHFRAMRANIASEPATFFPMGGTRAVAPAISQDGSRIAFASKDDPLGTNPDGNSEIFLFDAAKLIQVTNTSPGDVANRVTNGNFQPSITDDGRFIAFSSNRGLAAQNSDGNLEIFIYDANAGNFTQLTSSSGIVGASDAKISGNGNSVAYIRDAGTTPSAKRDLLEQPRAGTGPVSLLAFNVQALAMTYGRAISDDGTRVVYSAETATDSSQVFLYDGRGGSAVRQITSLAVRSTEVPLHPTISGDGTRIAFATRRPITGFSNSDNSIELYTFDIPTGQFARVTSAPAEADGFDGSLRVTEVESSLNDDGSIVAFNFPRALSGVVTSGFENKSEIYVTATTVRPPFGVLTTVVNGASFGNEPSSIKAVAPDSIAVARGNALANTTMQTQRLANGPFPTNVGGTTVTVNGRSAQIFFVSPGQVNFLVPPLTEIGNVDIAVTNADNFSSRAAAPTLLAAPGVFTKSGDGTGPGMILNADTLEGGPFDPTSGNLRLSIFATGAHAASQTLVTIGGRVVNAESVIASPDMPGLDELHVRVPADLRGAGTVNLFVQCDGRDSNPVTVTFTGDPSRSVLINEVLADPPDGIGGDANHDGVRDGTQDEFVEFVNPTTDAIGVGGWAIRTRATGGAAETTRFTFAAGTTLPAGEAMIVFGGGNASFNPNDNAFGCAQVGKATSSAGLSLTNGGLTVVIRDGSGNLIREFAYGGSTGLDGNNNQSLTRSPDITGNFVQHTTAAGANGQRFSPGLRVDGRPFDNCPGRLTSVTTAPPSASIVVGETAQFTAQAFDQFGRHVNGMTINFASDNKTVATVDSVSMNSSTGVATANVSGHNPGTAHITASATDGITTVNSSQSTLTVTGPSLSIDDVSRNEGNSGANTFTFTVSLSTPAPISGVTFNIATQDATATVADNDYVARSLAAQTIPAGQQTYNFDVAVNGDLNIEANENFFVSVANVSGASVSDGPAVGTILNDDSPVLSIDDISANEGNGGTSTFTFTVRSTLPAPAGGITFDIATVDGAATAAAADYVTRSLADQTIPAGQTSYTFAVTVNGDTLAEPNETFLVNISSVSSNAAISDSQGVGTIQNDDTALLVISQVFGGGNNSGASIRNDFVEIYNRGTTTVDFTVTPYSIQYASVGSNFGTSKTNLTTGTIAPGRYFLAQEAGGTTNGAALPAPDATGAIAMAGTAGKVALVVGTTALSPANACPGDDGSSAFNANNSLIADLVGYGDSAATAGHCYEGAGPATAPSNTNADFRKAGGCVDTNENGADFLVAAPNPRNSSSPIGDCKPEITINDPAAVTEGDSGTKSVAFTVSLSAASGQTVTVNYATADGAATAAGDYQSTSGLLTFNPGELTKTISVLVNGDTLDEPNENFFVKLSNATNAVLLDPQSQGTINDNDPSPSLSINVLSIAEGDSGTTPFTFNVGLSAASGQTVTVNYATADNTASAGSDYQSTSGVLTFNPSDTSKPITVLVNGDSTFEPNETFFVNLASATNASISDPQGQGTITNDDAAAPTPTLLISDVPNITEGDSGTSVVTFTVTLSPSSSNTVRVDYVTANGTATTAGNDYQSGTGTLTFNPGDTSKPITVTINGDRLVEPDETFTVDLSNATGGAAIGTPLGTGTIQNDDTSNLVISQVYGGGGNSGATFQNDFVEIFNRGTTTIDFAVTPYSVQYGSSSATFTAANKVDLMTGTLAVGQYFLLKLNSASAIGATFTADLTHTVNLSATDGKVALVSGTTLATTTFGCPTGVAVADIFGYGSANCSETAPVPALTATRSALRKSNGCTDTNNNLADFTTPTLNAGTPPRNTSSPLNDCNAPPTLTSVTIAPLLATIGVGDTQQFMGQALDQFGQPIGGVTVSFASNDTNVATVDAVSPTSVTGSATATVTGRTTGSAEVRVTATNGSTGVTSSPATLTVEPAAGQVLISEFRTRGPGGAADEFIEIYNPTTLTVIIGGLLIRSSNTAGSLTTRATITAGMTLGPGCHYLFAPASFSAIGTVPPDQSFSSGITDDGSIAITRSDSVTIIDAVGMSAGSAYKEGTTPLTSLAGTSNQSYERKPGGASGNGTDTNNNANDFVLNSGTSNPQNSSSGCLNTGTADLSISKTDSPDPVTVGSNITCTITVTNNGIGTAQNVLVTDNMPSGLTYVSCNSTGSGVCDGTGNNRSVSFSSLAVGSSATITLVATVNGTGGATISNTASVGAATSDPNSSNNSSTATTTVSAADLSMTKSDSPDPVNAADNITYTLVVTNNSSTIPAQSVTVSDQVPANTTFVSSGTTPAGWTRTDATAVGQTGTITFNRSTLPANGNATFTITVRVDSNTANNSTISNTATVSSNTPDDNSVNNSATQTTTVRTPADLSISKTVNNASPNVGEQVTFTITVSNGGPYAATGVSVKDQIPAGLTYVSDDGAGFYVDSTGIWTVGTVNASATATLHITTQATSTAVNGATNTAEVVAADQFDPDSTPNNHTNGEDDQANASVTAQSANLSLTKTVNNSSPNVGQDVTFTITLNNAGPNAATNVQVKDLLPAGLTFVSSTQSQGSYISSSGRWTVGSVNASGSATLTITATVPSAGLITNIAEVTACDVFDPDSTPNNHNTGEDDQAGRTISSLQADLSLLKSVDNPAPNVGGNVVFTIAVPNVGPSAATNVQVKDLLPTGLTYVSDDGAGAYTSGTGIWTVGTVNASATATLHITATATSASINGVTNTAEIIASDVPDPDSTPSNQNPSEDDQKSVTMNAKDADLSITKTDSPDPVLAGGNITYTISVTNNGPDPSLNLALSDSVPGNATFQTLTPAAGWTCTSPPVGGTGAISCTAASLAVSQTDSFALVVKVNAGVAGGSIISNTASVSSSTTFDPASGNNSVTQTTTVQASANLSITKTDSPDPVAVGNDITYAITVTNGGPDAATSAALSDTVPTNTTFRSISSPGSWTCATPAVGGTGSISCTNPSFAAGSAVFTVKVRVGAAVADGTIISNTASVSSGTLDPTTGDNSATQTTTAKTPLLVISQIYPGGNNAGATYQNDFIEIFNRGTTTVDFAVTPYSVQYAGATAAFGASNTKTDVVAGTIAPGHYFLIQESGGTTNGVALPTPDAIGNINMATAGGKVALVLGQVAIIAVTCPGDDGLSPFNPNFSTIVDLVGYNSSANCYEGSGPAAFVNSNARSTIRTASCTDTNVNSADFSNPATAPVARNSATAAVSCP